MRFTRRIDLAALAALACVCVSGQSRAAVILSETFEGPEVGTAISTSNSIFTAGATASSGSGVTINSFRIRDTDPPTLPAGNMNPFTGTKYLEYIDGSAAPHFNAPIPAGALTNTNFRFAFDYFEPLLTLDTGFTTHTNTGFFFAAGTSSVANTNRALGFTMNGGDTGSVTVGLQGGDPDSSGPTQTAIVAANEHIQFELFGTTSATPSQYVFNAAVHDLAAHTVDVYANGVLIINDGPFRHIDQIAGITRLGMGIANGSGSVTQQKAYFDNILLETMPPVPEPSAWALIAGGLAALGFTRRKGE